MQPAAPGRTIGGGNCGVRRKWIVSKDICSYMVPPNMATPWLTPASRGTFFTQGRALAGHVGSCLKKGCVRAMAIPHAASSVPRSCTQALQSCVPCQMSLISQVHLKSIFWTGDRSDVSCTASERSSLLKTSAMPASIPASLRLFISIHDCLGGMLQSPNPAPGIMCVWLKGLS
eukprot:12790546-Heterocapsa_arctica.AAC.1